MPWGRAFQRGLRRCLPLLCALAMLAPALAAAQDKPISTYFRETWTTRQGLPHNQVNAIAQTPTAMAAS